MNSNGIHPDEAMLVGLLHDVGKLYILTRAEQHPEFLDDRAILQSVLAEWHCATGSAILSSWNFPEEMCEAVDHHEVLEEHSHGASRLIDLIAVANLLANRDPEEDLEDSELQPKLVFERLGISLADCRRVLEESADDVRELIQVLRG